VRVKNGTIRHERAEYRLSSDAASEHERKEVSSMSLSVLQELLGECQRAVDRSGKSRVWLLGLIDERRQKALAADDEATEQLRLGDVTWASEMLSEHEALIERAVKIQKRCDARLADLQQQRGVEALLSPSGEAAGDVDEQVPEQLLADDKAGPVRHRQSTD